MKILIAGAGGYIGVRLCLELLEAGHEIYPLIRNVQRLQIPDRFSHQTHPIEADLLIEKTLSKIPFDLDAAYYLVHSMRSEREAFSSLEERSAHNFVKAMEKTRASQIIYLSGLVGDRHLSAHLASRKKTDEILRQGRVPVTTLMAGIIIGSGSASFEIIRDLVEKLPVMVAPRWINNLTQPIAIRDVLEDLLLVLGDPRAQSKHFEIGGPDVLSYRELLLRFAQIRRLKRWIITVPVLTPRLSSYWLFFITKVSYPLAKALVESLQNNAICRDHLFETLFHKTHLSFEEAVQRAFARLEEDAVPSSWKDALGDFSFDPKAFQVPQFGTFFHEERVPLKAPLDVVKERVWSMGGDAGWPSWNWAWRLRGMVDRLLGGIGLRRGRTHRKALHSGDALDFWRVLLADEKNVRLLLYAEMKLPGEAWLEIHCEKRLLILRATFRPRGIWGRIYWICLSPFHFLLFSQMARKLAASS